MTSWQVVIELGRKFDVEINGDYHEQTPVLAIPFGDRESAEAAQREIRVYVRPVHDAGGEDYRPVVPGIVIGEETGTYELPGPVSRIPRETWDSGPRDNDLRRR